MYLTPKLKKMSSNIPSVTVILCTHKFVNYAEQQIISIKNQINVEIKLVISIDSDKKEIIQMWVDLVETHFSKNNFKVLKGPKKGFSSNFISTLININDDSDYIAFSDHDDIWDSNKIYRAICCIKKLKENNLPILYGSKTKYIDENDKFLTLSNNISKPLTFRNALVQCFAGGNTMVFNNNLYSKIKKIGFVDVKSHDWWLYLVATAVEGKIIYDKNPYISYRQHNNNISGGNKGIRQVLIRIKSVLSGDYRVWNQNNIYYLQKNMNIIHMNNAKTLNEFIKIQNGNFYERFFYYFKSGIYRQNFLENIAIFIFVLLKKI